MAGYILATPIKHVDNTRLVFEDPIEIGPGSGRVRLCFGTSAVGEKPTNSAEVRGTLSDETRRKVLRLIRDDLLAQGILPPMGSEEV